MARTSASRGASRAARARSGRSVFGVPERFMRPRLVLVAAVACLVGFGALMVFSASSVSAMSTTGDAAYYLKRELVFIALGAVVAVALARIDYHWWVRRLLMPIWVVTAGMLLFVLVAGTDNDMGASRWIDLGFFDLQPSEFAKMTIIFTAANLAERYYEEGSLDFSSFWKLLAAGVGAPLLLILLQPDKGTTMVLGLTLLVMGYLAGMPRALLAGVLALGVVGLFIISVRDAYSLARLQAMIDPWSDPYDKGYHLIQGFYAFGSGGLFGVGIGFSRQKYSYLPMAHNDFILAVIGEECGLVGTLGMLVGFAVFMWAGLEIARRAPDFAGRLVAAGCTSLVMIQLLLNVSGVLGLFPLSGKPIPFVSYGGSSMIASLMIVGMIASVSVHSRLPETEHDDARRSWRQVDAGPGEAPAPGLSFVGEATPRSRRGRDLAPGDTGDLGAARTTKAEPSRARGDGLKVVQGGGSRGARARIDLGPSAADRLRGRSGGRGGARRR
ncbi:MAG: putative peptidoglycan glycosyltransferase FtsW [Atopobiaceae bacterium]|nr:putative peptidoglycan glycosyltransferase FtsW [Atopobiaceae bacterium]